MENHLQLILWKIVPKSSSLSNDTVLWNSDSTLVFYENCCYEIWNKLQEEKLLLWDVEKNGIGALDFGFLWKLFMNFERRFKKKNVLGFEKKWHWVLGFCFWQTLFLNFERSIFFDKDCLWILRKDLRRRDLLGYKKNCIGVLKFSFW